MKREIKYALITWGIFLISLLVVQYPIQTLLRGHPNLMYGISFVIGILLMWVIQYCVWKYRKRHE
jgi:heme/copper-type cytochrome/quinol oxidase subunit 2